MRQLAHVDTLTSLANRRDLDLRLTETGTGDSVVLVDLDHFKLLNDTFGHAAGDAVLAEFGLVIRATLRQNDYAARYGGEEFALVLPTTSEAEAAVTLGRLRQSWAILRPEITFSSGIVQWSAERTLAETLRVADEALYAAKESGRNRDHGSDRLGCRSARCARPPEPALGSRVVGSGWQAGPHAARPPGRGLR